MQKRETRMARVMMALAGAWLILTPVGVVADEGSTAGTEVAANVMREFELPEGPGRDEVEAYCGACHSLQIVVQQGLSRDRWSELLIWMVEEQDMAELEAEEHKLVLDYLATHLGTDHRIGR